MVKQYKGIKSTDGMTRCKLQPIANILYCEAEGVQKMKQLSKTYVAFLFILLATLSSVSEVSYGYIPRYASRGSVPLWAYRSYSDPSTRVCKDTRSDCEAVVGSFPSNFVCETYRGQCDRWCGFCSRKFNSMQHKYTTKSSLRTLSFYQYVGGAIPRTRFNITDESKDCFNRAFLLHIDKYRLMSCFRKVRLVTFTCKYEDHQRCRHHQ